MGLEFDVNEGRLECRRLCPPRPYQLAALLPQQPPPFFFSLLFLLSPDPRFFLCSEIERSRASSYCFCRFKLLLSPSLDAFIEYIVRASVEKAAYTLMSSLALTSMKPQPFYLANSAPISELITLSGLSTLLPTSMTTVSSAELFLI